VKFFTAEETSVTPLVAAALWLMHLLHGRGDRQTDKQTTQTDGQCHCIKLWE